MNWVETGDSMNGKIYENDKFKITVQEYLPELYELDLDLEEKRESEVSQGDLENSDKQAQNDENPVASLKSLLARAAEDSASDDIDSLLLTTHTRKYDKILEGSGFFYEITDYILEFSPDSVIIDRSNKSEHEIVTLLTDGVRKYCIGNGEEIFASCRVSESKSRAFVSEVETSPAHRRKGLATALINYVTEKYAAEGKDILLHTNSENPAALALYKKCGFIISEELHSYRYDYE